MPTDAEAAPAANTEWNDEAASQQAVLRNDTGDETSAPPPLAPGALFPSRESKQKARDFANVKAVLSIMNSDYKLPPTLAPPAECGGTPNYTANTSEVPITKDEIAWICRIEGQAEDLLSSHPNGKDSAGYELMKKVGVLQTVQGSAG